MMYNILYDMICDISENGGEGGSDSAQKGVLEASERSKISRKVSLPICHNSVIK